MSFSAEIKGELARIRPEERCCARAEIAAAFALGGITIRGNDRFTLCINASDGATVRHYFALLKKYWGVAPQIRVIQTQTLGEHTVYGLIVGEEHARAVLKSVMLYDKDALYHVRATPRSAIAQRECCRKAFLRSAFLLCGTTDNPENAYALEFDAPGAEYASFLVEILQKFDIPAKMVSRRNKTVVYSKKAESIGTILALTGATQSFMKLENIRVRKEVTNSAHRLTNCDNANIRRTTEAAQRQVEDIRFLDEVMGLDKLSEDLRALAVVRMEDPGASLTELGQRLDPLLGKSGVNARLRKISALANKLRDGRPMQES